MPVKPKRLLLLCCCLALVSACGEKPERESARERPAAREHLVEVETVRRELISTAHERTGSLRARRTVRIHNQEEGRITSVPFYEGDRVKRGDILIQLEDNLLRAELDKARATARQARVDRERLEGLVRKKAASKDELTRAKTALDVANAELRVLQTRLEFTRIKAPFDGVISERLIEPGDVAASNSHLLTVSDPTSLVTEIHVSELLLPHLRTGDPAQVRIDALGRTSFTARILRIHPELDPVTRQGTVEVTLEPVPKGARAGQFARVTLETARVERILIPFAALKRDREGAFVYRLDDSNKVQRAAVRSGIRIGNKIEILQGLEAGERIVSRGFLGLSEDKTVKPVNE